MDFDREFPQTTAGYVVPMITASLSTVSSLIILYIISKSIQKLSTTYHRLMALMSFSDLIGSVSVALVTIPMPKDDKISFSGPMLGNRKTCQAQGYLISFGFGGSGALYCCLTWYYVLALRFKLDSVRMKKVVEPIMYVYSLFIASTMSSVFLSKDFINTDEHSAFCTIAPDHTTCDENSCERDSAYYSDLLAIIAIWIVTNMCLIMFAMFVVLYDLRRNQAEIKQLIKEKNAITTQNKDNEMMDLDESSDRNFKLLADLQGTHRSMVQSLLYILAYILTWFFMFLRFYDSKYYKDIGASIFFPLQGLWNVIIFVYDKACLVHEGTNCDSWWEAVKVVIFHPVDIPTIVLDINELEIPPNSRAISEEEACEQVLPFQPDVQHTITDLDNLHMTNNNSVQSSIAGINSYDPMNDNPIRDIGKDQENVSDVHSQISFEGNENRLMKRYPFFKEAAKTRRYDFNDDLTE